MKRTDDQTLISALRVLARDIQSEDGVANAAIAEAADRIEYLIGGCSTHYVGCHLGGYRHYECLVREYKAQK